jgi:predicted Zn-ribbon and HTH transcriptional regulator
MVTEPITIPVLKCAKCGYEWIPRVPQPAVCPKCKRTEWRPEQVEDDGAAR